MGIYDDTKLAAAVEAWAKESLDIGFGVEYSKALLLDFDRYAAEHGLMKGSPGPVALGKQLKRIGMTPVRRKGLRYWKGASLKNPVEVAPHRNMTTLINAEKSDFARTAAKQGKTPLELIAEEAERDRLDALKRMKADRKIKGPRRD